jgi:FtsH-binding integral membrane protein
MELNATTIKYIGIGIAIVIVILVVMSLVSTLFGWLFKILGIVIAVALIALGVRIIFKGPPKRVLDALDRDAKDDKA